MTTHTGQPTDWHGAVAVERRAAALELVGVSRTFGSTRALDGISMRVEPGTVHCVLGENGAGKSTLCNIVYGSLPPTAGEVLRDGRPFAPRSPAEAIRSGIAMVHQHFSLLPSLTVSENLLLSQGRRLRLDRRGLTARLRKLDDAFGLTVDPEATVGDLSVGARQNVELVKALLAEPDLLLLDEPTAVLGPREVDGLLATCRRLADAGRAVVLITHKLGEVLRAGDVATVLRDGRVVGGGALPGLSSEDLVSLMVGRPVTELDRVSAASLGVDDPGPAGQPGSVTDTRARHPGSVPALHVAGVSVAGDAGVRLLDDVNLVVAPGEIVGVAGVEGNGQNELVAVLSGARSVDAGTVTLAGEDVTGAPPARRTTLGLGVVPEDRHHEAVIAELSVAENLLLGRLDGFSRLGLLDRRRMRAEARKMLDEHGVRAAGPDAPMASLSGGNQQKTVLARELSLEPLRCVVAAQPTRGLDIGAVDAVVARLRQAAARGVGVLVVSSELPELFALCDRIVVAYRGRLLGPVRPSDAGSWRAVAELMTGAER